MLSSSQVSRRARVGAAVDRTFGESFRLAPRRRPAGDPDARYVPDPGRQAFDFVGRFTSNANDLHARARATAINTTKPIPAATPTVTVVQSNLLGPVREGDLITRRSDGSVFVVGTIEDGEFERVVLKLRSSS